MCAAGYPQLPIIILDIFVLAATISVGQTAWCAQTANTKHFPYYVPFQYPSVSWASNHNLAGTFALSNHTTAIAKLVEVVPEQTRW
jgi:hypothetical protein